MHRFLIPAALLETERVLLPEPVARQISRVLRLRAGERVVLFCGDGGECEAVLETVEGREVTARVTGRRRPEVELSCALHVGVALLKGEKLDWTIQKLTELGAARISFVRCERAVSQAGDERWSSRLERYARIAAEATEQCGRVRVPELDGPVTAEALLTASADRSRLILHPGGSRPLAEALRPCPPRLLLLVGPEGGFSDAELARAQALGAETVSLGPRVLRAETAALAAAALIAAAAAVPG